VSGTKARIRLEDKQKGDVPDTWADIRKARKDLDYAPKTTLENGLKQEWLWIRNLYSS
jgi:UDP-glucose 4-epimerase